MATLIQEQSKGGEQRRMLLKRLYSNILAPTLIHSLYMSVTITAIFLDSFSSIVNIIATGSIGV